MNSKNSRKSGQENHVVSFQSAVGNFPGGTTSVCIKFVMHDSALRISHWPAEQFSSLYECLEFYSGAHYYGSDMQRAYEDPTYAAGLSSQHPVHTLNSQMPNLTVEDYVVASKQFSVRALAFEDHTTACQVTSTFVDGTQRIEVLPQYIAMNLYGSLRAGVNVSGLVNSKPGGTA